MAQIVGSRWSRLARKVGTGVGVAGLPPSAYSDARGSSTSGCLDNPLRLRGQHDSNTVSVINTSTNKVVKTVRVGNGPTAVAITPNGSDAYVANFAPTP